MSRFGIENHGITKPGKIHWNLSVTQLVEEAVRRNEGMLTATGGRVGRGARFR